MHIDLHTHTTASDGAYSPAELVKLARKKGVTVLGITDHDTTAGVDEGLKAARKEGITVVPGVEINAYDAKTEYHILGYYIDHHDPQLVETLDYFRKARLHRMRIIIQKLNELGINLTEEDVLAFSQDGVVGRVHIAKALQRRGFVSSVREAFDRYIAEGKPAYARRSKLTPEEAIGIIRKADGIPVLAHPGLWGADARIEEMTTWGLAGLEVYTPDHDAGKIRTYLTLAEKLGLLCTGGSDFHGHGPKTPTLGAYCTPPGDFERLKEYNNEKQRS